MYVLYVISYTKCFNILKFPFDTNGKCVDGRVEKLDAREREEKKLLFVTHE
jgi:hypothetical protein